mmetsp:Transcript_27936/g.58548  ORF Transcript_27936/g.58548 Transcript_27936/m.58548 type:complete len:493 (+) Transcript_27936:302-1780(+)
MLCSILFVIISAVVQNHSAAFVDGLFVFPTTTVVRPYPRLQLKIVDELVVSKEGGGNNKISYEGFAYDAGSSASIPQFALSLDAKFTRPISKETFDKLLQKYCGWSETKSRVKYKPDKLYRFTDFLPPLMQATNGLHFKSSNLSSPPSSSFFSSGRGTFRRLPSFRSKNNSYNNEVRYVQQEILLTYNCWGFAWEVLFQADNADTTALTISTADPNSAFDAFRGPGFDLIQSTATKPQLLDVRNVGLRNSKIQPGDVLLIWHQNPSTACGTDLYLDHVATCIDEDVYFEKSGSGDSVPFRVSTWEMITANFPPAIFVWEWRRLVRNNPLSPNMYGSTERLKPAEELFGVESQVANANAKRNANPSASGASDKTKDESLASASSPPSSRRRSFWTLGNTDTNGITQDGPAKNRWSAFDPLLKSNKSSGNGNDNSNVGRKISLQLSTDENDNVESQLYTGILVLEDLRYSKRTGRARLPSSAYSKEWYQTAFFE